MSKKLLPIFSLLLVSVVGVAAVLLIVEYINNPRNIDLLIISLIFTLITFGMIISIIFDFLVGHKEFVLEKERIIISRKGKILYSISKGDISNPVLTCDANNKESRMLSFKSGKKKYYVSINKGNKKSIYAFLERVKYTKRENTIEYFLQHLLDVLSAI